jgi:hypothetical protein
MAIPQVITDTISTSEMTTAEVLLQKNMEKLQARVILFDEYRITFICKLPIRYNPSILLL